MPAWLGLIGYAVLALLAFFAVVAALDGEWGVAVLDGALVAFALTMILRQD